MGRKPLEKSRKDSPERKQEWIDKLIPLFFSKGIKSVSMNAAAEYLGVSKATLYKYFTSREEILQVGLASRLEQIAGFVPLLQDQNVSYIDRYTNAISHFTTHTADITNTFLADLKHYHAEIWKLVDQFSTFSAGVLEGYYREGVSKGIFRDLPLGLLVETDRFFFDRLSDPAFLIKEGITVAKAFESYFQMKFYGIIDPQHPS